jgi:predicted nucleic acid-binding protein
MAEDRFTVDSNIFVGAIYPTEKHHAACVNVWKTLRKKQVDIHSPWTLPVEVVAAVSRKADGHKYVDAVRELIRRLNHTWYKVDENMSIDAWQCAAKYRLRGMDAIYAAVAESTGAVLVTDDRDVLEKLDGVGEVKSTSSEKFFYKNTR